MKKLNYLLVPLIFSASALFARPCPGEFEIDAEYLYLLPSVEDTYFVIDSASNLEPYGERINNDFDFHSGFRVGAAYGFCCGDRDFAVYYTRLSASQSKDVTGPFLSAVVGPPSIISAGGFDGFAGSASSDLDLLYQRADALFEQHVFCGSDLNLYLQFGAEFAYFSLDEDYIYSNATDSLIESLESKTWGIGPQFGLGINYDFCHLSCFCPGTLSIVANASGSILASRSQEQLDAVISATPSGEISARDDHSWRLVPAFHARVGLSFDTDYFSCLDLGLEVGYQFDTYINAHSRIGFVDDSSDGATYNFYHNYDFQGLYVKATVSF